MHASLIDLMGFSAAVATFAAFACKRMLWLRIAAICANLLFIAYAWQLGLMPILALHMLLLPLNLARLRDCLPKRRRTARWPQIPVSRQHSGNEP